MDLLTFIIISVVYIMLIHFAIAVDKEFNVWLMIAFFILGGVLGSFLHSYETGFILGIILSLMLW